MPKGNLKAKRLHLRDRNRNEGHLDRTTCKRGRKTIQSVATKMTSHSVKANSLARKRLLHLEAMKSMQKRDNTCQRFVCYLCKQGKRGRKALQLTIRSLQVPQVE
jgi:hypothetical protein